MSDIKQVGNRLKKHLTQTIEGLHGELGRLESTGSYTVPTGQVNEVFVRLNGDASNTVTAINQTTKWQARLPVRLRLNTSGRYEVTGVDPLPANEFLGSDAGGANMPPIRGANVDAVWESYQFQPGRIHALNGSDLQVKMEPLPYFDRDIEASGDMATVVATITSGKKAWIGIAVDPVTSVLSFTKGTEYPPTIPLTRAMALEVTVPSGEIPLWAYPMRAGDTFVPVQKRSPDTLYFVDRRPWLQPQIATGGTDTDAVHVNVAAEINGITAKATPVSGDVLIIEDSAASYAKKSITIGDLPAASPSIFDILMSNIAAANSDPNDFIQTSGDYIIMGFFASHNANSWLGATNATYTVPGGKTAMVIFHYATTLIVRDPTSRKARVRDTTNSVSVVDENNDMIYPGLVWNGDVVTPSLSPTVPAGATVRIELWNVDTTKRAMGAAAILKIY